MSIYLERRKSILNMQKAINDKISTINANVFLLRLRFIFYITEVLIKFPRGVYEKTGIRIPDRGDHRLRDGSNARHGFRRQRGKPRASQLACGLRRKL